MTARELAAQHGVVIGCGNNSCVFGPPGGMATNGGCRCLRGLHDHEARRLIAGCAAVLTRVANGGKP